MWLFTKPIYFSETVAAETPVEATNGAAEETVKVRIYFYSNIK